MKQISNIEVTKDMIVFQNCEIEKTIDLNVDFYFVVDINNEIQIIEDIELVLTNQYNVWEILDTTEIKLSDY